MSTNDKHKYSDELLGLLGELSGKELEQVKTIFSPEARRAQRRFLEPEQKISETATSLTALERELLAVHRAELGQLMQDACLRLYLEHKKLGPYVLPSTPRDLKLKPDTPAVWKDRARRTRCLYPDPEGVVEPLEIMSALMTGGECKPDLLQVAQAGLRIAPSTALRSYLGLGHFGCGDLAGAETLFRAMLGRPTPAVARQKVTCWMGQIALLRGEHPEMAKWSRLGALGSDPIPSSALDYFSSSVQAGDERGALEASSLIPDALSASGASASCIMDRYCRILSTDRLAGRWHPTAGALQVLAKLQRGLSPQAQRILDAFR